MYIFACTFWRGFLMWFFDVFVTWLPITGYVWQRHLRLAKALTSGKGTYVWQRHYGQAGKQTTRNDCYDQ
jgi:hypothetical protein